MARIFVPTAALVAGVGVMIWLRTVRSADLLAVAAPLALGMAALLLSITWYGARVGARVGLWLGKPLLGAILGGSIGFLGLVWGLAGVGLGSSGPVVAGWSLAVATAHAGLGQGPLVTRLVGVLAVLAWIFAPVHRG